MASEDVFKKIVREAKPLPNTVWISTCHITHNDSLLLARLASNSEAEQDEEMSPVSWIFDYDYGFTVDITDRDECLKTFHDAGCSAALYHLVKVLTESQTVRTLKLDCDGETDSRFPTFEW